jgi:raffinose/stachyose/melibiose transport system permease protein
MSSVNVGRLAAKPRRTLGEVLSSKRTWSSIVIYLIMILFALIILLPLLWLLSSSLKTLEDLAHNVWGPPKALELSNYVIAWTRGRMAVYMRNSLIVAAVTILLTLVTSTTISYALSRFNFKFNRLIYYLVIAGMMIPIHSAVIPLYIMAMKWKMQNNLFALGAIYAAFRVPVSVFILESFMLTIPKELEECAIIDGCGYAGIFWKIILPLSRDGVVTILILAAIACWNELLVSMLLLSKPMIKTLPIGLMGFITEYEAQYTQLCAGLLIAVLPNLLFYALMQERIVKGMTIGALKG